MRPRVAKMTDLKQILQEASERRLKAGSASAGLIENLKAYRMQQFWIFVVMQCVVIAGVGFCAYYLTTNPQNSVQVKLLSGLIGIGAGGGIEVLRRVWKEWSQTQLLLLVIPEASEAQITALIDKLLKK